MFLKANINLISYSNYLIIFLEKIISENILEEYI